MYREKAAAPTQPRLYFYVQDVRYAAGAWMHRSRAYTGCTVCGGCMVALEHPCSSRHLYVLYVGYAGAPQVQDVQLEAMGFATSLHATNPQSDNTAPSLESFSVLTPEVFPADGEAHMQFAVMAADNKAGIEAIRVELRRPSDQILYAWGNYSDVYPLSAETTVETATLSTLLEMGEWQVGGCACLR
jgi:hypothetical protein